MEQNSASRLLRTVLIIIFITHAVQSCVLVLDVCCHPIKLKNCTSDSLYIGISEYDNIDSVHYCLIPDNELSDYDIDTTDIYLWNKENVREDIVLPDSICCNNTNSLFGDKDTGYIYVIQRNIALNNSWTEICKKKKYDKITVIKSKQNEDIYIEYKGKGKSHIDDD